MGTVKIKSKKGHVAEVLEESWPAYEAQGEWSKVGENKGLTDAEKEKQGEQVPNQSYIETQREESEKKGR